jgi:hypothetical protein
MQTMERIVDQEEARPPEPTGPRRASARDVFVTILVCLSLWALLAAPLLERNAQAGPVGTRRSAALALLRPLMAISDTLLLSRATSSVERALGRDPEAAPGGELALPAFDLPAEEFGSTRVPPGPSEGSEPTTAEPPARADEEARPGEGPAAPNPSNPSPRTSSAWP